MKAMLKHGSTIETLTPKELEEILRTARNENRSVRVRSGESLTLDATGAGTIDAYKVPSGFEFEARRVTVDLDGASATTAAVPINAGKTIEYLRSGQRMEWGAPAFGSVVQVPGIQTWSREQGPYLRNGEVFQVRVVGLTPAVNCLVTVEGILARPPLDR